MTLSIAAIFAAGLLTFASPCVLPLMPLYLTTIAGGAAARARRGHTLLVATAFVVGFAAVFVALGALATSFGAWLTSRRASISVVSGLLMLMFGLRALGLLRIPALDRDARPALLRVRHVSGVLGSCLFGAAFALGWSPCIGPVLTAVLTYAATHEHSPWRGAGYLLVYAAGIGAPLLVLAGIAEHATAVLKRFQRALPRLEKLTGGALLAFGAWTALDGARALELESEWAAQASRSNANTSATARLRLEHPPATCDNQARAGSTCAIQAGPVSAQDTKDAPAAPGPHLLEFTARDCPVCRLMRPVVDSLTTACGELATQTVRIDVGTARGRALAAHHGVRGTPTLVLVDGEGVERARLIGANSREDVASAVEGAFGISCWSPG